MGPDVQPREMPLAHDNAVDNHVDIVAKFLVKCWRFF
jgi:hypothetical protein